MFGTMSREVLLFDGEILKREVNRIGKGNHWGTDYYLSIYLYIYVYIWNDYLLQWLVLL